jgi:hypothetical protein
MPARPNVSSGSIPTFDSPLRGAPACFRIRPAAVFDHATEIASSANTDVLHRVCRLRGTIAADSGRIDCDHHRRRLAIPVLA